MWGEIPNGKLLPALGYYFYIESKSFVVASNYWFMNKLCVAIHCHMFQEVGSSFQALPCSTLSPLELLSLYHPKLMEPHPAKKPRGQKQRLASASTAASTKSSVLVTWLEEQWAWGSMSAQCIQKIAHLALQDMVACGVEEIPPTLQKLASIGTFGHHSANCHRDLMNVVSRKTKVCAPLQVNITLKGGLYLQSIMLPHELFHCMWERYNAYFLQTLTPAGEAGMRFFWDKFQNHPCMELATWTSHPSFPHKCIPLGMHGDAVPTTGVGKVWAKMQLCFSWSSLLKITSTKASNFLIWSVPWLTCFFHPKVWSQKSQGMSCNLL